METTRRMTFVLPEISKPFESAHNMPLMKGLEERDACKARSMMIMQAVIRRKAYFGGGTMVHVQSSESEV